MSGPYSLIHDLFRPDSIHLLHTPNAAASMLPLRIFACGHYYSLRGYRVERQGLNNRLLVVTLAGKGQIAYRGVTFPLTKGQAFLIDCNELQQYECAGDDWEIQWVRFEENAGVNYEYLINAGRFQPIELQRLGYAETRLNTILQQANRHAPAADLIMAEALCGILTDMYEDKHANGASKLSSSAGEAISETIGYMERHYAEEISVKELARMVHMTPYAFIRLFKRQIGLTPYEYLLKSRITHARFLLEQTDLSVTEIAEKVGFRNANNFIRKFKMLANATPLQYRRLNGSLTARNAGDLLSEGLTIDWPMKTKKLLNHHKDNS